MTALAMCTAADVARKIGGTAALTQIIPDGTDPSTYDATLLASLIADASEELAARGNVQVDMQALAQAVAAGTTTWPPYLVDITSWFTAAKVWDAGAQGQAKPTNIAERERYILDVECERLRKRQISFGAPTTYPGTNQIRRLVDADPNRDRLMRPAFRCKGGLG